MKEISVMPICFVCGRDIHPYSKDEDESLYICSDCGFRYSIYGTGCFCKTCYSALIYKHPDIDRPSIYYNVVFCSNPHCLDYELIIIENNCVQVFWKKKCVGQKKDKEIYAFDQYLPEDNMDEEGDFISIGDLFEKEVIKNVLRYCKNIKDIRRK